MPELIPSAGRRDARRHGARGPGGMRAFHLLISLLPAALLAVAGAGTVVFLLAGPQAAGPTRTVLISAAAAAVIALAVAAWGGSAVTRRVRDRLAALRSASARGQADLLLLAERVHQGERPSLRAPDPVPGGAGDPFVLLARDLQQERHAAREALLQVAVRVPGGRGDHRAEITAALAARMQSLVHQEIQLLAEIKGQVWEPGVLQDILTADHLAARTRRHLESLAVIAGAGPLRQWSQSMTVSDMLEAAAAGVEHSSRVTVVPPVPGALRPAAVADVMHLVAELVDNATRFSAPHARTLVRADAVTAGLAIEVEDRGNGMAASDRHRINALLSHPSRAEADHWLSSGRTGLFVVSELARRHGIEVQLQGNIYGGTQAVVVLPGQLLEGGAAQGGLPHPQPQTEPFAAVAGWPEPPPPTPLTPPPPPSALAEPPALSALPAQLAGRPAELNGHALLPAGGGQPHPAPPPREQQAARGEEPAGDRIADLMAAFRNPARQEDPDPDENPGQPPA